MWDDPIVKEVRKIREEHAAQFNYDLQAIYDDLKKQERKSRRKMASYPPRSFSIAKDAVTSNLLTKS